jgi:hypothetical protein
MLIKPNKDPILFHTHEALDQYHQENSQHLEPDEVLLLKAFHRAFQCEEAKAQKITIDQMKTNCLMGNPTCYSKEKKVSKS